MKQQDYLRRVITERIRILKDCREKAKPQYRESYDISIRTLEWVLSQFSREGGAGTDGDSLHN